MRRLYGFLVRIAAFVRKEMVELLRQPRLVVTLVLGPFLILLLFGVGYTANPLPLHTLFVIPEDSVLRPYFEDNADSLIQQLVFEGIVTDEEAAKAQLRAGQVDMLIVVPADAYETVRESRQVTFVFYHREIDPIQVQYVQAFAKLFVREMNQRVLRIFAEEGQREAWAVAPDIQAAHESVMAMLQALDMDQPDEARQELSQLRERVTSLESAVMASALLLGRLHEVSGQSGYADESNPADLLEQIREDLDALAERNLEQEGVTREEVRQKLTDMDRDLARLDALLSEFRGISSAVLVSPLRGELASVLPADVDLVDYYVPSVIAVLLQHLCVTFGALSIVRESRMGIMELFQVSPLSALEVLAGKYLSYVLFISLLIAVLSVLMALGLGVPMLGAWSDYAIAVLALVFASLGVGFVISLLAQTTGQAVQYSMLILLVSVFFTGFFLNLEFLQVYVRLISWTIPGTYAIQLLQGIMLRGQSLDMMWAGVLLGMGVGLFALAWFLLRQQMSRG